MPRTPIQIKRYPNRRYYARHTSQYVSLKAIEELVQSGETVEIRDSQTGEDLTRAVLTQIIMERQPDKLAMFPADMLHFIVRSNDAMSGILRDYFHQSLTYLDYLQRHSTATPFHHPIHWVKSWLEAVTPQRDPPDPPLTSAGFGTEEGGAPAEGPQPVGGDAMGAQPGAPANSDADAPLVRRVRELEERLRKLESPPS